MASAAPPQLVGVCVDGVNSDGCYGRHDVCIEVSRMVPFCVDTGIECTEACNPCMTIQCDAATLQGGPGYCMYYYYEVDTGVVRYVQRDSCHSEIYVNGERVK